MLKNLLRVPDTFEPDDRRRRQVLNILLIAFMLGGILAINISLLIIYYHLNLKGNVAEGNVIVPGISLLVISSLLIAANRSPRISGRLIGTIFITIITVATTQSDTPQQLYNGHSLIAWVIPIMLGAVILHPGSVFVIAAIIVGLIQLFTPNGQGPNYYAMGILFEIAFITWLGMSIANRAILDARRQAANLQAIFDSVGEGVLVLDLHGNLLSANPALYKMIPEDDLKEIIAKPLGKMLKMEAQDIFGYYIPGPRAGLGGRLP